MEEGEQRFPACEKLRVDNGEEEKENNWQFVRFFFLFLSIRFPPRPRAKAEIWGKEQKKWNADCFVCVRVMRGREGKAASVDLPADTLSLLYRILNTPNFHNLTFTNQLSNSAKRHSPCPLFLPSPLSFPHVHGIRMSSSTISTPPGCILFSTTIPRGALLLKIPLGGAKKCT